MTLLAHPADRRTLFVMALATAVAVAHWVASSFSPALFGAAMLIAFAIAPMHHNHSHRPLWRHAALNRASEAWFALFQGHPGYVFAPMHVENHHRFHNGPDDVTRTDRYRAGNDLVGLLRHPFEFAWAALPHLGARLRRIARGDRRELAWILFQYLLLLGLDVAALWLDWRAALYVVLAPQAAALFWLTASNYLQHAHACAGSDIDHARNFTGAVNWLGFNVGYHTAHHHAPERHWSELPALHRELAPRIAPVLIERSLAGYCLRTFLLALVFPRHRSRPLRARPHEPAHERHDAAA
jgi:fatty acid desaturase